MGMRTLTADHRAKFETDLPGVALEMCHHIMIRMGGLTEAVLVGLCPKGARITAVPMPFDIRERTAVAEACRHVLLDDRATAYAFAFEAWMRSGTKEDLDKPQPDWGTLPGSKEAVMILGQTPDGSFHHAYDIIRSASGSYVELRGQEKAATMQFTGIWSDLLYRQQAS